MDLSSFITYDKKESLLLSIAKSNQEIVENTHSTPQETLEFKMNKQKESFSFDVPLILNEKWMMGVTSLEVYNTVYKITISNNKLQIILNDRQLDALEFDTGVVPNIKKLYETYDLENNKLYYEFIEKANIYLLTSNKKKKLPKKDFDYLKQMKSNISITIPNLEIENEFIDINLVPGGYELIEINNTIKQIITDSGYELDDKSKFKKDLTVFSIEFNIIPDTISMKSVLTTSNPIHFNSELNKVLGFTQRDYPSGNHTSEKPVMITTTDKVHLKCDCVDGSIVNGIREQILFSFNLSAPPGYKIIKEPTTVLYKLTNKTRLDTIQFFLEDSNHDSVDFNGETLTFTIQIIKI